MKKLFLLLLFVAIVAITSAQQSTPINKTVLYEHTYTEIENGVMNDYGDVLHIKPDDATVTFGKFSDGTYKYTIEDNGRYMYFNLKYEVQDDTDGNRYIYSVIKENVFNKASWYILCTEKISVLAQNKSKQKRPNLYILRKDQSKYNSIPLMYIVND